MARGQQGSGSTVLTFNEGKPKLTADVIGADVAILTFESLTRNVKTRVGDADVIVFKEYPEHWWFVNTTSLKRIAAKYGLDYAKWAVKPIVVFAKSSSIPGSGKPTTTLWAADPDQSKGDESWDVLVKEARKASKK